MTTLVAVFTLGAAAGFMLKHWLAEDDLIACTLDNYTPVVRWWHRHFGHGAGYPCAGVCWACGPIQGPDAATLPSVLAREDIDDLLQEIWDAGGRPTRSDLMDFYYPREAPGVKE